MRPILLIQNLDLKTAILCAIFLRKRYEIYYLVASPSLCTPAPFEILRKLGLTALSHAEHSDGSMQKSCEYELRWSRLASEIAEELIFPSPLFQAVTTHFRMPSRAIAKFRLAVEDDILGRIPEVTELTIFADAFLSLGRRLDVIAAPGPFSDFVLRSLPASVNIWKTTNPVGWILRLISFIQRIRSFPVHWKRALARARYLQKVLRRIRDRRQHPSPHDQQILFFPHVGIYYGKFFKKDHYYSRDSGSPFHPKKILHLSLGDSREIRGDPAFALDATFHFYETEGIPFDDWFQLGCNPRELVSLGKIARDAGVRRKEYSEDVFQFLDSFVARLELHIARCASVPQARIALIGYECLFPADLNLALELAGIVTVAAQERFILPFCNVLRFTGDHYFVTGNEVTEHISANPRYFSQPTCIPIGPLRLDLIHQADRQPPHPRYAEIRSKYFLFLVFDWPSAETESQNRRQIAVQWKNNKVFYRDIIRLALKFPDAFFMIKGKSFSWMTNPRFEDLAAIIRFLPNIDVETRYDDYDPYQLISWSDAALGLHTSLGDEMLAAKKPVVFMDYTGYPAPYFDYAGGRLLSRNFEETEIAVRQIMEKQHFSQSTQFAELRERWYCNSYDGQVLARLHDNLNRIFENSRRGLQAQ